MNIASALAILLVGFGGLVLMLTGIEALALSPRAACHGPHGAFVLVTSPSGTTYTVQRQDTSCEAKDVQAADAALEGWEALSQPVDMSAGQSSASGWLLGTDYGWRDGYAIATESLAGNVLNRGIIGWAGALALVIVIAALAFREYTGRWWSRQEWE